MLHKILILIALIAIFYAMGSSMYYLMKDSGQSKRMVKILFWRIALSLFLLLALFFAYLMGWLHPHPL